MQPKVTTVEMVIGDLARRNHGVVTRQELLGAGIGAEQIKGRVRSGLLLPQHRGVYRVGHRAPSLEALYLAAVKACGKDAVLGGRAAAHLLELTRGPAPRPEVIAPGRRLVKGVRTRRSSRLAPPDVTNWRGIPVTTVPRTLIDLAAELTPAALARACHEADVKYGVSAERIDAALARRPNAAGAGTLRRITRGEQEVTLSELERRFLVRLREAGLPLPVTNRPSDGWRVDCRWPERRLTVELDSYRFHRSRHAWERDRRRERDARAAGDEFRRYTYGDVCEDPAAMLSELRELLSPASSAPAPASRAYS